MLGGASDGRGISSEVVALGVETVVIRYTLHQAGTRNSPVSRIRTEAEGKQLLTERRT